MFATASIVAIIGTAIYKQVRKNHNGDHTGYLPVSAQEDVLAEAETDVDDQENLGSSDSTMHLGQVSSGRYISVRDAMKTLATLVSLAVSVVWMVSRSYEDKDTYLYLAPLVSTCVWVSCGSEPTTRTTQTWTTGQPTMTRMDCIRMPARLLRN